MKLQSIVITFKNSKKLHIRSVEISDVLQLLEITKENLGSSDYIPKSSTEIVIILKQLKKSIISFIHKVKLDKLVVFYCIFATYKNNDVSLYENNNILSYSNSLYLL
jgi:hypothetical protein